VSDRSGPEQRRRLTAHDNTFIANLILLTFCRGGPIITLRPKSGRSWSNAVFILFLSAGFGEPAPPRLSAKNFNQSIRNQRQTTLNPTMCPPERKKSSPGIYGRNSWEGHDQNRAPAQDCRTESLRSALTRLARSGNQFGCSICPA